MVPEALFHLWVRSRWIKKNVLGAVIAKTLATMMPQIYYQCNELFDAHVLAEYSILPSTFDIIRKKIKYPTHSFYDGADQFDHSQQDVFLDFPFAFPFVVFLLLAKFNPIIRFVKMVY